MEMLENNQQGTESRTALVEDSVHHLQGDLSIFVFINWQKGLSQDILWLASVTRDSSFVI